MGQFFTSKIKLLVVSLMLTAGCATVSAQDVAVKTNVVSDAFANINLGTEITLAPKWSFDLSGDLNLWTLSEGTKWKHWLVQPELRYWLCQATAGHFFALHLLGGQYNVANIRHGFNFLNNHFAKLKDHRYQGWFAGAGIAYGYSWVLGRHWNVEAELGVGWAYTRYDKFPCANCGRTLKDDAARNYVGPTKAALNLVYVF